MLSDPYIAIGIMCDSSSADKCRRAAKRRIDWFNSYWESGYGVRAITIKEPSLGAPGRLLGWCGVAGFSGSEGEPEILYGLNRGYWGKGLITEAGWAAIDDFFSSTEIESLCAIVFDRLNEKSIRVAERLGLRKRHRVSFADFSPGEELRKQALDYAIWCAGCAEAQADEALAVHATIKAGLIVGSGIGDRSDVCKQLCNGANGHAQSTKMTTVFYKAVEDPTCCYLSTSRLGTMLSEEHKPEGH